MRAWLDVMVEGLADPLAVAPERVVSAVPDVLGRVAGAKRGELLERVQDAIKGRLDLLDAFADGLFSADWHGAKLASAQVCLSILEQDPQRDSAVQGIARALSFVSEYELAYPLVGRALTLTDRDPVLALSWVGWLYGHDRVKEADEYFGVVLSGLADPLAVAPERVVSAVPDVLGRVAGAKRGELLERVQDAIKGRLDLLDAFADGLFSRYWPGAEWASAQVCLSILEQDPQRDSAVQGIARALSFVSEYELAYPLVGRALTLTDHDPVLALSWVGWLYGHDRVKEADEYFGLVLSGLADPLAVAPERVVSAVPDVLGRVAGAKRGELLERVQDAIKGRLDLLDAFADGLFSRYWPGAEWASAQVCLSILEQDPQRDSAVQGIARALSFVSEYELAYPLVGRALTLTDHDPVLAQSWADWLLIHRDKEAHDVAHPLVDRALTLTDRDPVLALSRVGWLYGHDRVKEADEYFGLVLSGLADPLAVAPERVVSAVPDVLGRVAGAKRGELLERVQDAIKGRLDLLDAFADGLFSADWHGAKLASAQVCLSILEQDPQRDSAVQGIARALSFVSEYELAYPLVGRALTLTDRDPVLALSWVGWLYGHDRVKEADEYFGLVLSGLADPLAVAPERVVSAVPDVLGRVAGAKRGELLERVQDAIKGRLDLLDAFADGLFSRYWPGAEWASAQVCLSILEQDPQRDSAVQGIARALSFVSEYELAYPLVGRALTLTDHDPVLAQSWADWLLIHRLDIAEEFVFFALSTGHPWPYLQHSHISISQAYESRYRFAAAENWLDRVSGLMPDDSGIVIQRANLALTRDKPHKYLEEVVVAMKSTAVTDDDRAALVRVYVDSKLALGRGPEVESDLEDPDSPQYGQWESADIGEFIRHEQLALLAVSAGALSRAKLHIEVAEGVMSNAPIGFPNSIRALRMAALVLGGQLGAALTSQEGSFWDARRAADLVGRQGGAYALPLREEATRRAESEGERAAALWDWGNELSNLGRFRDATSKYEDSRRAWTGPVEELQYYPYGPFSLHNIASSLSDAGDYESAMKEWRQSSDEYQDYATGEYAEVADFPYFHWARSSVYQRLDRIGEAFDACRRGLELDPDSLDLLSRMVDLGRDWEETRARRTAAPDRRLKELLSHGEITADEADKLSMSEWRTREALRQRGRLLAERAAASNSPSHFADYGEFLLLRKQHNDARQWIQKAIRGDSSEAIYHVLQGRCYLATDDAKRAREELAQALALQPDDHEIRSLLGNAEATLGNRDAALAHYTRSRDRAPAHVPTLISLANLYVDMSEHETEGYHLEQAINIDDELLELNQNGSGSKFLTSSELAAIFYQRGYCRVGVYERSARQFKRLGMLRAARIDFELCRSIDPHHEKALRAMEKVAEKAPGRMSLRERVAPWAIVVCALIVFIAAHVRYHQLNTMTEVTYLALSLGAVALTIAGFILPELLKLKVGGVELEKGTVQQSAPTSFGLSSGATPGTGTGSSQ